MNRHIVDLLICPSCLPEEMGLVLDAHESEGIDILRGILKCPQCRKHYAIAGGIADLHAQPQQPTPETKSKYEGPEVISSYLWSHYADLFDDPEVTGAYPEWAAQIDAGAGFALDTGCAVGRFAFELSRKCDFAIGLDSSRRFIALARKLLFEGRLDFDLKQEGRLFESRSIELPKTWDRSKVDFVVADAQALPFRSHRFSCVASLNLVDKLLKPLLHLKEISRAALTTGTQLLFSDPFSWSTACAEEEDWLGGKDYGAYAGFGLDKVQAILEGEAGEPGLAWTIERRGEVWWKIRNHRRHFELIRSGFIKAVR